MGTSVSVSKEEYDELVKKARLFDHYVETEELSAEELRRVKEAMKGPFLTKSEFLKKHTELS